MILWDKEFIFNSVDIKVTEFILWNLENNDVLFVVKICLMSQSELLVQFWLINSTYHCCACTVFLSNEGWQPSCQISVGLFTTCLIMWWLLFLPCWTVLIMLAGQKIWAFNLLKLQHHLFVWSKPQSKSLCIHLQLLILIKSPWHKAK